MNAWTYVIGWTLTHFVWQGTAIAFATAIALRACGRRSPATRHAVACVGLLAMLAASTASAVVLTATLDNRVDALAAAAPSALAERPIAAAPADDLQRSARRAARVPLPRASAILPFVVWTWTAGVAVLVLRFGGGCWRVRRLRGASLALTASQWQASADRLAVRLRIRTPFRVVDSDLVDAPGVIGWMRPIILLPLAVLTNLTPGQVDAILAHELAHIRRRDYLINLLQTLAETLLFYHPAVWWISARIRLEREHCCDDAAVEVCGEPEAYAAALAELAAWRAGVPALAMAAANGPLVARVRRLLKTPDDREPRSTAAVVVLGVVTIAVCGVASAAFPAPTSPTPVTVQASAATSERVRTTDHFEIHYPADLDLHADRVARDAEAAYARVSTDLRHNLAFKPGILLARTTKDLEEARDRRPPAPAGLTHPPQDAILLAVDRPADQWRGILTHEVTHVFGFDILPASAPRWVSEGLAEYERDAWDPADLASLRAAVRGNAVPLLSVTEAPGYAEEHTVTRLGHAAFDFIESRWGKPGVRQFMLALRQAASGGDPYQRAFQIGRGEFDEAFAQHLKRRFSGPPRRG